MDDAWDEKAIFVRALGMSPAERDAFLRAACPTATARARIEALLSHHAGSSDLLARTPHAGGAVAPGASGASGATSPPRFDEFEVLRELGRGGMGVVHLARDRQLGRLVALKVLAPHLADSDQAKERLRREARAVAALSHPGIVPIYRAEVSSGRAYIAMEFVPGETLQARILAANAAGDSTTATAELPAVFRDPAAVREAARIIADAAEALDHAHQRGIVHRDVKPSNIIVDAAGRPRLMDFGIAKVQGGHTITTTGDMAGTLPYMSPEQTDASAEDVQASSDIWSLGVVLYELLALRRPFVAPTPAKLITAIQKHEPPDLRGVNHLVSPELSIICHMALEKRPNERYRSAAQMAADLRSVIAGEGLRFARPPGAIRRARRWVRRHPTGIAATAAVGSMAVAAGGVTFAVLLSQWRQCDLVVQGGSDDMRVQLLPLAENGRPGDAIDLGSPPTRTRVPVGVYRLSLTDGKGRRADAAIPLVSPGGQREIVLPAALREPSPDDDMIPIPGGVYAGGVPGEESPQGPHSITVEPFLIDRTEVTNGDYRRYVEATGAPVPDFWTSIGLENVPMDLPVAGITWWEAQAYAIWAGKRLPTADEWEVAMRLPDDRLQPWGEQPVELPARKVEDLDDSKSPGLRAIRTYLRNAQPADSRPDLATDRGILHAASNLKEFTETVIVPLQVVVVKGASWSDDPAKVTLGNMVHFPLETMNTPDQIVPAKSMKIGFRCVRSASP